MAMLAERKIKQKWSLNPRGKEWSEDSNKFGQKMLEKMGWSKGKGLGAKEDGITEHLKVSCKNDSKGMGYKESNDQWTEHDYKFNTLLTALSTENPIEKAVEIKSLEERSQKSKVRVHYHKFTRGKDLSRYSEKDLANIFGKKSLNEQKHEVQEEIYAENDETNQNNNFIVNTGSMVDYFKKKLPNFQKKSDYIIGNNGVLKKNSECDEENENKSTFISYLSNNEETENTPRKQKKKRKLSDSDENKTKKIKTDFDGIVNPAFDPLTTKIHIEKHTLETIEENNDFSIIERTDSIENQSIKENINEDINKYNEFKKKKKKKSKKYIDNGIDNPNFNDISNTECSESTVQEKKKNKKSKLNGIDNPNFKENENSAERNDTKLKKKQKNKEKENDFVLDNPAFSCNDSLELDNINEINKYEVKVKSKKSKKNNNFAVDNPCFNDFEENDTNVKVENLSKSENIEIGIDNPSFVNVNCKEKMESNGIDNPNFVDSDDLILNICLTPIVSKENTEKKNKKEKHVLKHRKSVRFNDINEERIIPNCDDIINDQNFSQKIDNAEAEIDNDINVTKEVKMIGEIGNCDGENEKLTNGNVRLKFKYANFTKSNDFMYKDKNLSTAKKSYKHLIKGDIILGFSNTNLHEIQGYAKKN